jgi:hypothetical protein
MEAQWPENGKTKRQNRLTMTANSADRRELMMYCGNNGATPWVQLAVCIAMERCTYAAHPAETN